MRTSVQNLGAISRLTVFRVVLDRGLGRKRGMLWVEGDLSFLLLIHY
jgi:hypothetical protein